MLNDIAVGECLSGLGGHACAEASTGDCFAADARFEADETNPDLCCDRARSDPLVENVVHRRRRGCRLRFSARGAGRLMVMNASARSEMPAARRLVLGLG